MTKMLDFDIQELGHFGMEVPIHTQETLENYLINGWAPGGFVIAMLAMDMKRAISIADTANRQVMWAMAHWIIHNAPKGSWGDYDQIDFWCSDVAGRRSKFAEETHKKYTWSILKR